MYVFDVDLGRFIDVAELISVFNSLINPSKLKDMRMYIINLFVSGFHPAREQYITHIRITYGEKKKNVRT